MPTRMCLIRYGRKACLRFTCRHAWQAGKNGEQSTANNPTQPILEKFPISERFYILNSNARDIEYNDALDCNKTEKEYQRALRRLDKIFDAKPGDETFREAELLVLLIENYETELEEIFPDPDPIEVIKFRMEQNNLRSKDLAKILGSKSKASELLSKKRRLTLDMIRKINKHLNIPVELLIGEYETVP